MFDVEGKVVHDKNHAYEITSSLCINSRSSSSLSKCVVSFMNDYVVCTTVL